METAITEKPVKRRKHRYLFQDSQGRWWVDYRTPEKRRVRKLCGSFDDARARAAEVVTQKRQGTYFDAHNSPTLAEFAPKYLEEVSSKKLGADRERRTMKVLLATDFSSKRLSKITALDVSEYRTKRLKTGVKNATVNREIGLLRHMFRMAIEWGFCAKNPARGLTQLHEQRRDRFLSKDEICQLRKTSALNISKANRAAYHDAKTLETVVETALHTGMRKGEILALEWKTNVNLEQRSVFLSRTKNRDSRRIPIDSELLDNLLEHRRRLSLLFGKALQEAESKLTTALRDKADKGKIVSLQSSVDRARKWKSGAEKWVFPSYDRDGNLVSLKDVKDGFGKLLRASGIKNFRFHDLRHTFASQYMMGGGNLYTLAKLLGHRDIRMTQRYADLAPDFIDAERERMDTIWTLIRESQQKGESASVPKYVQ